MDTPVQPGLKLSARTTRVAAGSVVGFSVFVLLGIAATVHPFLALSCLVAVAMLRLGWLALRYLRRVGLEVWQILLLITLTGYIVLNYGFENLTVHVGIPLIVSYVLMLTCFGLAAYSHPDLMRRARKEPAILCLLALLLLASLHLVVDLPHHGLWAIRDASKFVDGIFLVLGWLWAVRDKSTIPLMKWLMVVFFLNLVYSSSLPWGEKISAWSPQSGVFQQVAILGNYRGNAIFLLLGLLFYMYLSRYVVRWPRWIILFLVVVQLFELAITQARATYGEFAVVLIIFVFLGEAGKSAKLLLMLSLALAGVLLLTTFGIEISGRVGVVSIDFLKEHVRSLSGAEDTPGSTGRLDYYDQAFQHIRSHPVLGEGFGMPLTDSVDMDHPGLAAIREPHNSNLSVLVRLGAIGFAAWVVFHLCLLKRFVYAFRQRRYCNKQLADFIVWLFLLYVIFMMSASVEAGFEFPSGSIPFYFFVGLTLGLIRWQVPQKQGGQRPEVASVPGVACNGS